MLIFLYYFLLAWERKPQLEITWKAVFRLEEVHFQYYLFLVWGRKPQHQNNVQTCIPLRRGSFFNTTNFSFVGRKCSIASFSPYMCWTWVSRTSREVSRPVSRPKQKKLLGVLRMMSNVSWSTLLALLTIGGIFVCNRFHRKKAMVARGHGHFHFAWKAPRLDS